MSEGAEGVPGQQFAYGNPEPPHPGGSKKNKDRSSSESMLNFGATLTVVFFVVLALGYAYHRSVDKEIGSGAFHDLFANQVVDLENARAALDLGETETAIELAKRVIDSAEETQESEVVEKCPKLRGPLETIKRQAQIIVRKAETSPEG